MAGDIWIKYISDDVCILYMGTIPYSTRERKGSNIGVVGDGDSWGSVDE